MTRWEAFWSGFWYSALAPQPIQPACVWLAPSDEEQIASDWRRVGDDIRSAMRVVDSENARP
jgi:hypothetical protein